MNRTTDHDHVAARIARGAAGGLAGAIVLQGLRTASKRILPASVPPMLQEPDDYLVLKAERRLPASMGMAIPPVAESIAAGSLAAAYGMIGGAVCAAMRPRIRFPILRGVGLGLFTWAVGYLGWLPRSGLMPPLRRQTPAQVTGPIVRHLLFGIVTVGVSRLLQPKFKD